MADEFNVASESGVKAMEFYTSKETFKRHDEFDYPAKKQVAKKESIAAKMRKMVYLIAACGSTVALGYSATAMPSLDAKDETVIVSDIDVSKPVDNPVKKPEKEPDAEPVIKAFDEKFPVLSNLEPNGVIPQYGQPIDEEYLVVGRDKAYALWLGITRAGTVEPFSEADTSVRYDWGSNTLYLDNAKGFSYIEANIMGNSFTIDVTGDCSIDTLLVWGFFYGGSVKITGNGTLTINKNLVKPYGIRLEAEGSESCLMIDKNVTVNAYGSDAAVIIKDTTMEKSIYVLSNEKENVKRDVLSAENGMYTYSLFDNEGNVLKEVSFGN